ncbi:hypothetical protein TIFTF001_028849 [Ficus carica]|uniref:Uncharacterized protein n=1 Tax=Ficus carica TaxID=3494 RepID=A0AA88DR34_FICCA|nr:hypothetical protein TIFTF001_028849 [Ficus carica]
MENKLLGTLQTLALSGGCALSVKMPAALLGGPWRRCSK